MPSSSSGICKALHSRRHSPAKTARQRAQENEAWRCVRKHAALILQQLKPGEAVAVPAIVVRPSFYETQERWITLQFLEIWGFVID
ncbi:hypothetical protein WJX75_004100 [Coccomyxa subellipsoidea]|uniref:Uncharacterized protein n=1 Tax=Coccomyxa subellipsoidea TaxID=248742 RepID=A0ABR2YVV3_9CHLO